MTHETYQVSLLVFPHAARVEEAAFASLGHVLQEEGAFSGEGEKATSPCMNGQEGHNFYALEAWTMDISGPVTTLLVGSSFGSSKFVDIEFAKSAAEDNTCQRFGEAR